MYNITLLLPRHSSFAPTWRAGSPAAVDQAKENTRRWSGRAPCTPKSPYSDYPC